MAGDETLKRLGGGRWETKDGRFTVEPESGTWVLVDNTQTNELGLPLVTGPFPSLTAAREAIAGARETGPAESPLKGRIERERKAEKERPPKPEPPKEPAWLRKLGEPDRKRVRAVVERLEKAGVPDAEALAKAEIADDEPALARLALERRLAKAARSKDARTAVRRTLEAIVDGRDDALGAEWRLVDGAGRELRELDLPDD